MFEPNTPQLDMMVKCSDALSLPLPIISAAGASGLLQAAWYDEHKDTHTYVTIDRLGIISAVWLTSLDEGGFICTESNPSGIVDIFQAHQLPLGQNVVGDEESGPTLQLELSDADAMAMIYAIRDKHGFTGQMYGSLEAVAELAGVLGTEEEVRALADDGVLMEALRETEAWAALEEAQETNKAFALMVRQAAVEASPALGRAAAGVPAPIAAYKAAL